MIVQGADVGAKAAQLVQTWGREFESVKDALPGFTETYRSLQAKGVAFPDTSAQDTIFTPPPRCVGVCDGRGVFRRLSSWRCGDGGALLSQVKRVALTPRGPCCVADSAVARAPAPATHGGETEIVLSGQGADGGVPPALPPPPPPGMQARRRPKAGGTKLHAALAAAPAPAVAAAPAPAASAAARTLPAAVLEVCARD